MKSSPSLPTLLRSLKNITSSELQVWLAEVADALLNRTKLIVFGSECLVREFEFYFHSAAHPDPFPHQSDLQTRFGQWYLHRTGSGLRNGNYKGFDFTIGNEQGYGGILLRSLELANGELISGPSLCVDFLLKQGRVDTVFQLNQLISEHGVWSKKNGLHLARSATRFDSIYRSGRVGLTLNPLRDRTHSQSYIVRKYRFLTLPRQIKKGRTHLILSLLQDGWSADKIQMVTGTPFKSIEKYKAMLQYPQHSKTELWNISLGPSELSSLYHYFG